MTNYEMQVLLNTFTTRSAAKMYLVAQGKPLNYAKAAVDETFNFEPDGDTRDAIWAEDIIGEGDFLPTSISAEELIMAYNTMEEMFSIENMQILLDGEALYDINGDHLTVGR